MKKSLLITFVLVFVLSLAVFAAPSAVETTESAEETNIEFGMPETSEAEPKDEETAELMATYTYGYLTYTISDRVVIITGCSTSAKYVTIPSRINGNPVTSIGSSAFRDCTSLESVTIGNSVTSIGSDAFYNCKSLASVEIPNSVTSIRDGAFESCTSLESVTIGNSVTSIGSSAFYNCKSLASVEIPNSVTSIGSDAFSECRSLASVKIGNSVTSIGSDAFSYCNSLASVTIGNSVTSIGYDAFSYCTSLASVEIPNSVTSIGSDAFYNCNSLEDVYICNLGSWCNINFVNSLSNPLYYADNFYLNSEQIVNLVIPETVTEVKKYAFYDWDSLKSVTIPDSVTSIGEYAFYGCGLFDSVEIPNSVTSIGKSAFYNCAKFSLNCDNAYAYTYAKDNNILVDIKHKRGEWIITTEPTCAEVGEKKIICTVCDDVIETGIIPEIDHTWGEWTVTKAPKPHENGIETRSCTFCGETNSRDVEYVYVSGISLSKPSVNLSVGDSIKLVATVYPEDASEKNVTWKSSDESVAIVLGDGNIIAIGKGTAIIIATAHDKNFFATCEINVGVVADKVEFTSLKTTSLAVGKSLTLKATASRTDGLKPQSIAVTYEIIEGKDFATIDAKGKLTAKDVGEVVVRATAEFGTEEAYADITINICNPATKVTLNTTKSSMIVDGTLKLKATMTPDNSTDTITWSVDKEDVATVDENGLVTAHKAGKVKVTAKSGSGKSASCTITIGEPATKVEFTGLKSTSLALGKSITLKAKASCEGKTKPVSTAVVFEIVEGKDIATLDAKGKLTAKDLGEVTVRARAEAGTEDAYADVTINICIPATKVTLNTTKASMIVDGTLKLKATMTPANNTDTLTWSVDKEDIATVDKNGVVTAYKSGKVKVTATTGSGKKATCTVTIGEPATRVDVTALKVTSVAVGKSITLKGKAACEGKTKPVSTAVVFDIIEGDDIATIDAKGKLTAKAEGTVVVRICTEAGTEEAYEDVEIRICNLATKVTLNMTKATIAVDDELQLKATKTAKTGECTDTLYWSVDKPNIATVDENGLVTAHSAGKVKVTATSGSGKKATCTVTVTK